MLSWKTLFSCICVCLSQTLFAAQPYASLPLPSVTLKIDGAADYPEINPLIKVFEAENPDIKIQYTEHGSSRLYKDVREGLTDSSDLIMSSAMDLQIKLVNDGYAQPHESEETASLPEWASWRNEIFGFTYEPAVIVYNHDFLSRNSSIVAPVVSSRARMLEYIRQNSARITGRIGTFDISKVGVGFLIWSHDSQQTGSYGRILESFGVHQARLFPSSASMLQAIAEGEIAIAYNVLGSYAYSWAEKYPQIRIVLPTDYTTVIMRSAFIPKKAPHPVQAKHFLDFLLSEKGQKVLAETSSFFPMRENIRELNPRKLLRVSDHSPVRPIPLGLPLLVQNDQMKRELLLDEWERALIELE